MYLLFYSVERDATIGLVDKFLGKTKYELVQCTDKTDAKNKAKKLYEKGIKNVRITKEVSINFDIKVEIEDEI